MRANVYALRKLVWQHDSLRNDAGDVVKARPVGHPFIVNTIQSQLSDVYIPDEWQAFDAYCAGGQSSDAVRAVQLYKLE